MEKRKFENMGIETSILGFGCMRFPLLEDGTINELEVEKMFQVAIDGGINYFDTAWPYHSGKSEAMTGKMLKKYPRDQVYIATKLPVWQIKSQDDVERIFNKQLENLQTDYIDFYLLHALNMDRAKIIENCKIFEVVERLKKEGKIKHIGFSFHDDAEAFQYIVNMYDKWEFCQIQLNYMDTDFQQGLAGYEMLKEKGIPTIIMEPVKGGKLASFNKKLEKMLIDENSEGSISSWAMRYVAQFDNVKVILSGMSNMEQLEDNIKTFSNYKPMSENENKVIEVLREELKKLYKVQCTSCEYCLPCPFGVAIPKNFTLLNEHNMYENAELTIRSYGFMSPNEMASNCQTCGECISKCPQKIDIPTELNKFDELIKEIKR